MRSRVVRWVALATLGSLPSACAVLDAFQPAGPREVLFTYSGKVDLRVGDQAPIQVTVTAGGALLTRPRLFIASLDSNIVALTVKGDSLVARKAGNAGLHIWLEDSMVSGQPPDTVINLHVSGGGPPGQ